MPNDDRKQQEPMPADHARRWAELEAEQQPDGYGLPADPVTLDWCEAWGYA